MKSQETRRHFNMNPTMRIFFCSKCKKKSEFTPPYGLLECSNKKCDHIFEGSRVQTHGINMNPMSRRTDIEFNSMSASDSADIMANAKRSRTMKTGKY